VHTINESSQVHLKIIFVLADCLQVRCCHWWCLAVRRCGGCPQSCRNLLY